jgi:acyl-CoA thioesterase FadM
VEGFPFVHYETARFSDLDGMGHVNNAVFSVYIEQARLAWFGQYVAEEPMPLEDVILARTEIDFRSQVGFDETVAIGVRLRVRSQRRGAGTLAPQAGSAYRLTLAAASNALA